MNLQGYKIADFNDLQPQIEHLHANGWDHGLYVGFPGWQRHYNMMPGSRTDWTGYPGSGKSELVLDLLYNMARFYGWVSLLYVPDIGRLIEVLAKLIHKHTGKTFLKRYSNYISIQEAFNGCTFLLEHFKIIHRTDPKGRLAPLQLWEYAAHYKKNVERLDAVLIDSWKDLYHDYKPHGGNYAQYLSNVLPAANEIAEVSGLHLHTVIHPKNPIVSVKDRKIYPPTSYDLEGGAQWSTSGKCIIAVHREDFDTNLTDVYFRKIKPESVGVNSSTPVTMQFDAVASRFYYTDSSGVKKFAEKLIHTSNQFPTPVKEYEY